ncbi:unnamed protein product [Closterium sp. Yama58-4]|nr:unnamed protein product [Closterium sp. Yama58-4]
MWAGGKIAGFAIRSAAALATKVELQSMIPIVVVETAFSAPRRAPPSLPSPAPAVRVKATGGLVAGAEGTSSYQQVTKPLHPSRSNGTFSSFSSVLVSFSSIVLVSFSYIVLVSFSSIVLVSFSSIVLVSFSYIVLVSFSSIVLVSFSSIVLVSFSSIRAVAASGDHPQHPLATFSPSSNLLILLSPSSAERWQYVQQQLAIIRSQIPPPTLKSPPPQPQLVWQKTTPSSPSPSPSPSPPTPSATPSIDGGVFAAAGTRLGKDTTQDDSPYRKPGLLRPEQPDLVLPPTGNTAALMTGQQDTVNLDKGGEEQRTEEWYALRANRLTASAFEKAVGFFPGGRQQLWEEKLGLRAPFAGNEATAWGQGREEEALREYERLTGGQVEHRSFQVRACVV